jgi:hypothetical protein
MASFVEVPGYTLKRALKRTSDQDSWLAEHRGESVVLRRYAMVTAPEHILHFTQRAMAATAMIHSGILPLKARGRTGDQLFVARAHLDGSSLREHAPNLASVKEKLRVILKIGQALVHVHKHGLVHGAVHADNVLFADRAPLEPQLVDLTLLPEPYGVSARSDRFDERTDQHALGRLCSSLLGKSDEQELELARAIARATSDDRDRRFAHLETFLEVIEQHLGAADSGETPIAVQVADGCIEVTMTGRWTRAAVKDCVERLEAALKSPGPWRVVYRFASTLGYNQAGVVSVLSELHRKHRRLLERVAFLATDPQVRGLGVILGQSIDDLPWKTFASPQTMQAWLSEALK